jgi:chromosome segregation ATPase
MTEDYEQQAKEAERELADMEERSERVGEHIDEARKESHTYDSSDAGSEEELPPPDPHETD